MNRGLLVLSVILIVVGLASNIIPLVVIGVFLLLPSLASGRKTKRESKVASKPVATPTTTTTWAKQIPESHVPESPAQPSPLTEPTIYTAQTASYSSSTPLSPIFQTQMFPTLNPIQSQAPGHEQLREKEEEFPKELLEIGAIFLLARFLSKGRR